MSLTTSSVNFESFFGNIASMPEKKQDIIQTCLSALKKYQADSEDTQVRRGNSMEVLGLLIANGAKGSKIQQAQAKKIAEALVGTKLFENASHSVRNNIETALTGTSWIGAKFREALLVAFNWHKYGADSTHKQETLLGGAISCLTREESPTSLDLQPLHDAVSEHNRVYKKDKIDQKLLDEFTAVVVEEWEKLFLEEKPSGEPATPELQEAQRAELERLSGSGPLLLLEPPPALQERASHPAVLSIEDAPQTQPRSTEGITFLEDIPTPKQEKAAAAVQIVIAKANDATGKARDLFAIAARQPRDFDIQASRLSAEGAKFLVNYAINTLRYPNTRNFQASQTILDWYKRTVIDNLPSKDDKKYARQELVSLLNRTSCGRTKEAKQKKVLLYKTIGAKVPDALKKYE